MGLGVCNLHSTWGLRFCSCGGKDRRRASLFRGPKLPSEWRGWGPRGRLGGRLRVLAVPTGGGGTCTPIPRRGVGGSHRGRRFSLGGPPALRRLVDRRA